MNKKICIFPGSFSPFHIGHFYVLSNAIKYGFEKVYIAISLNENKINKNNQYEIKKNIECWLNNFIYKDCVEIIINYGKTTTLMKELNVEWIIRGYRNQEDFDYEINLFKLYELDYPELKFRLFKTDEFLSEVSSSKINKNKY